MTNEAELKAKDLSSKTQDLMKETRKSFQMNEIKWVISSEESHHSKKNHVTANFKGKKAGFSLFWGAENISEVSILSKSA